MFQQTIELRFTFQTPAEMRIKQQQLALAFGEGSEIAVFVMGAFKNQAGDYIHFDSIDGPSWTRVGKINRLWFEARMGDPRFVDKEFEWIEPGDLSFQCKFRIVTDH